MALAFSQKLRASEFGGKAFRCYEVTCDGSTVSIDASDLDLNIIDTAMVFGPGDLIGNVTISGSELADGVGSTMTVEVVGAVLGDAVEVASDGDDTDILITAYVESADAVEIRLQNEANGARTPQDGYECRIRKSVALRTYSGDAIVFGPPLRSGDKIVVWAIGG